MLAAIAMALASQACWTVGLRADVAAPIPDVGASEWHVSDRLEHFDPFAIPADDHFPEASINPFHAASSVTLFPEELIYPSYLAGPKESRLAGVIFRETTSNAWLWDIALGGRVGLARWGESAADPCYGDYINGWQLDIEGAAFPRLELDHVLDMATADFRFGVPLTYGAGAYQMKFAYYHLSSHLGDEHILRTGRTRINYVRDALVWGHGYQLAPEMRVYGEAAYSFHTDGGAEPWELQFGFEWTPRLAYNEGAPYLAVGTLLQEEHNFGGSFTVQAGWSWRSRLGRLLRVGVHWFNGKSPQFEFFDEHENQIGFGIWYDY